MIWVVCLWNVTQSRVQPDFFYPSLFHSANTWWKFYPEKKESKALIIFRFWKGVYLRSTIYVYLTVQDQKIYFPIIIDTQKKLMFRQNSMWICLQRYKTRNLIYDHAFILYHKVGDRHKSVFQCKGTLIYYRYSIRYNNVM